ncbi:hypothetical protein BH11PAT2_BH11PAT2_07040 [soil metagenome]
MFRWLTHPHVVEFVIHGVKAPDGRRPAESWQISNSFRLSRVPSIGETVTFTDESRNLHGLEVSRVLTQVETVRYYFQRRPTHAVLLVGVVLTQHESSNLEKKGWVRKVL